MAAEIGGSILFGTLFTIHHSAPFLVVLALNLVTIPALRMLDRQRNDVAMEPAGSHDDRVEAAA